MYPPTVPADEQKYMPQKHNYSHIFDRLPFSGEIEVPAFHPNGKKKLRNKMQVMETVSLEGGGRPNPSFIKKHQLDKNSEPQDWFNAFLPVFECIGPPTSLDQSVCTWVHSCHPCSAVGR